MKTLGRRMWLLGRLGFWAVAISGCMVTMLLSLPGAGHAGLNPGGGAAPQPMPGRPPCPPGWTNADDPATGLQAYVPPGFRVRLTCGMFAVDRVGSPAATAYLVPFCLAQRVTAGQVAQMFAQFAGQVEPSFRSQLAGQPGPEQASVVYAMTSNGQPIEGRYTAVAPPAGRSAYIVGVSAAQGRLAAELPVLGTIARSLGLTTPTLRWVPYRSPQNSMTLQVPQGWTVETTEGMVAKNEVDWWAYNPANPAARAFSTTPRFCTPDLAQGLPLHAPMNGYQPRVFQTTQELIQASISQLPIQAQVRLTSMTQNQPLTRLFNQMIASVNQALQGLQAGGIQCAVYECQAAGQAGGTQLQFSFVAAVTVLQMKTAFGVGVEQHAWCRGWFAPPEQDVRLSPVLDKIQGSFEYTPEYRARVFKEEGERAAYMRSVHRFMAKVDREIAENHWKTNDAIARMMYDVLTDRGGYYDPGSNQIEDGKVKNSRGEAVSGREVAAGVHPDQATVLTPAFSKEYEQAGSHVHFGQ